MGLGMLAAVADGAAAGRPWHIRIGIHRGAVVAGVIGSAKFAYDVWGDTVNTASRMESAGAPGRVNISRATYELVRDLFKCEERGRVEAKGKGEVEMFFVNKLRGGRSARTVYDVGDNYQDDNDEQRRGPAQPPRNHPLGVEVAGTQRATA
jgi:class 3 adenylate cyclase